MSYMEPIDLKLVQAVVDDLEDHNAHTICDLLMSFYDLPYAVPRDTANEAYEAAREVFDKWRHEMWVN